MNLLLVLLQTETGKTVSRAISSLQEHGVRVEKIILVTLFATPQGENYMKHNVIHVNINTHRALSPYVYLANYMM